MIYTIELRLTTDREMQRIDGRRTGTHLNCKGAGLIQRGPRLLASCVPLKSYGALSLRQFGGNASYAVLDNHHSVMNDDSHPIKLSAYG